jgi:hypothetical protein
MIGIIVNVLKSKAHSNGRTATRALYHSDVPTKDVSIALPRWHRTPATCRPRLEMLPLCCLLSLDLTYELKFAVIGPREIQGSCWH